MSAGTASCPIASTTRVYRRRRPERTVLYRLVQRHLETWLSRARENDPDGAPLAAYVERELRGFLSCGILAHGFARARCGGCGHDFLVAFSCKGRGICPACTTRRMVETAARLVDHVFPRGSGAPVGDHVPQAPAVFPAPRPGTAQSPAADRAAGDRDAAAPGVPRCAGHGPLRRGELPAAFRLGAQQHHRVTRISRASLRQTWSIERHKPLAGRAGTVDAADSAT